MDPKAESQIQTLLKELKDPGIPLLQKYRKQNELKVFAQSSMALDSIASILPTENESMYKRLLLDIQLEAKNVSYIVELLKKSEQPRLIKYALKQCSWIFKQKTSLTDPVFLINEILPFVSFTTQKNIIHKIEKHYPCAEDVEKIYKHLQRQPGPSIANSLLPACSSNFVSKILSEKDTILSNVQMTLVLRKHQTLAIEYMKREDVPKYRDCMRRVGQIDPISYIQIYKNIGYGFSATITRDLLKNNFQLVQEKPKEFVPLLHKLTFFKHVGLESYTKFLVIAFPITIEELQEYRGSYGSYGCHTISAFWENWINILPNVVNKKELFKSAIKKSCGLDLSDCLESFSPYMMNFLSQEDREIFIDSKLADLNSKDSDSLYPILAVQTAHWVSCKPTHKSIPTLKGLIKSEPDHSNRQEILIELVKTCAFNHDGLALNHVIQYYVQRHRNERSETTYYFINEIEKFKFDEFKFEEENATHWLEELIKLHMSFGETAEDLLDILYCTQVKLQLSTKWSESTIIKSKIQKSWGYNQSIHRTPEYFALVLKMIQEADKLLKKFSDWSNFIGSGLNWCWFLEQKHATSPNNQNIVLTEIRIFLEAKIKEILQSDLENEPPSVLQNFVQTVLHNTSFGHEDDVLQKCVALIPNEKLFKICLKQNLEALNTNWDKASQCIFEHKYRRSRRSRRGYHLINLLKNNAYNWQLEKIIENANAKIRDPDVDDREKANLVRLLSVTMNTYDFLLWAEEVRVTALTQIESSVTVAVIQRAICNSFKSLDKSARAIPALLEYCQGEFLPYSLGSLYWISRNIGAGEVKKMLEEIAARSQVSVRKHGIRLMIRIALYDSTLNQFWEENVHPTIRRVVLCELLPRLSFDESAWEAWKSGISSLTNKDKESMVVIEKYSNIPSCHLEENLTLVWRKLQQLGSKIITTYGERFVRNGIVANLAKMRHSWLLQFIQENLIINGEPTNIQNAILELLVEVLLIVPSASKNLLDILNQTLNHISSTSNSILLETESTMKFLETFIRALCTGAFKSANQLSQLNLLRDVQAFEVIALLSELSFSMKVTLQLTVDFLGKEANELNNDYILGNFIDSCIIENGVEILPLVVKDLNNFLDIVWHSKQSEFTSDQMKIELCHGMLMPNNSINEIPKTIVTLSILPHSMQKIEKYKTKHGAILDKIRASKSSLVHLYFQDWLRQI